MTEFKPPMKLPETNIFLAGSIEQGTAEDWQKIVTDVLKDANVNIFNPRRDEWDSTWEQSINNPQFVEQVGWELAALDKADIIFMYFAPGTMSPISLLEFGLYANSGKMIVVCPDGFWRKGNIDITSKVYNVPVFDNLNDGIKSLLNIL